MPSLPQWTDAQQKQGVCGIRRLQPDERLPVGVPFWRHGHHCVLQRGGWTFKADGGWATGRQCSSYSPAWLWDHTELSSGLEGDTRILQSWKSHERCCSDFQVLFFPPPGSSHVWFSFQKKGPQTAGSQSPRHFLRCLWPKNVFVSSSRVDLILFFIHLKSTVDVPYPGLPQGLQRKKFKKWLHPQRSSSAWGADTSKN